MLEKIIREAHITTEGNLLYKTTHILAYADDIDIVGRSVDAVKEHFVNLERAAKIRGLEVNESKTKFMTTGRYRNRQNITIDEYNFEAVGSFKYLGTNLNARNDLAEEINERIILGNRCYYGLAKQLKSNAIRRRTKVQLYKTLIRPVITYGSEAWCLNKKEERRLETFERKILRKIYGPIQEEGQWRKRYNFEIKALYDEPDIIKHIKCKRLRWLGHVHRMGKKRTPKQLMNGKPEGKRKVGRPRNRWMDAVERDLKQLNVNNWKMVAENRGRWGKMLEEAKIHPGL